MVTRDGNGDRQDYAAGTCPTDDLTTRARIRDAAMAAFAEHGYRGATMRGIAAAPGCHWGWSSTTSARRTAFAPPVTSGSWSWCAPRRWAQVEKLADRISIIRDGVVVQTGTLAEMRHLTRTTIEALTVEPVAGLEMLAGIHDPEVGDRRVRFSVEGEHLDAAVKHVAGFGLRGLTSHPPTLDELMLRHYGSELRGNAGAVR